MTEETRDDVRARRDAIVLSVRLKSGGFESSLEIPTTADAEVRDAAVRQWLDMMSVGVRCAEARFSATLAPEPKP